jgi:hypothetical protein
MAAELTPWHWTEPSAWLVTLASGAVVEVWADGFTETDGYFVFTALIDAEREPRHSTLVMGRTPTNHQRFDVALARFPAAEVSEIASRRSGPA